MKTKLIASLFCASILSVSGFGQSMGNKAYGNAPAASNAYLSNQNGYPNHQNGAASAATIGNGNIIDININGLMNVVADEYLAVFNVVQVGLDIAETDQLMNSRLDVMRSNLKKIGIDSSAISIDLISFIPRYSIEVENKLFSKSNNEVPAGFELQKNIMVHFTESSKLDGIVTAAASAEIYDIVKVDYFIENLEQRYDTLMNACAAEVKERIKFYENLGFRLDTLRKAVVNNYTTTFPIQRYFTYQAFARPAIPTSKKGVPVKLNEMDKTISRYYNQIESNHYDLVIHPVLREPAVQLSFSIHVQYYLNESKPIPPVAPKNNYFLILEKGEIKQIFPNN